MTREPIKRGEPVLQHPITHSYIHEDDDGNIRIGTEMYGDAIFIKGTTGEIFLNANRLHIICNEVEWNDLVFNKAAINPTQPAFKAKQTPTIKKELANYGS
jgi:hypothetical protein